jgi:hypothetical protein
MFDSLEMTTNFVPFWIDRFCRKRSIGRRACNSAGADKRRASATLQIQISIKIEEKNRLQVS